MNLENIIVSLFPKNMLRSPRTISKQPLHLVYNVPRWNICLVNLFNVPYHMFSQSVISWLVCIEKGVPILKLSGGVVYKYLAPTELLSTSFTRKFLRDMGLQIRDLVFLSHHQHLFSMHTWIRRTFPNDFQIFLSSASSLLILHISRSLVINSFYIFLGRPLVILRLTRAFDIYF